MPYSSISFTLFRMSYCKLTQFQRPFALVFAVLQYWQCTFHPSPFHPFRQTATRKNTHCKNYFWFTRKKKLLEFRIVSMISFSPHCCCVFIKISSTTIAHTYMYVCCDCERQWTFAILSIHSAFMMSTQTQYDNPMALQFIYIHLLLPFKMYKINILIFVQDATINAKAGILLEQKWIKKKTHRQPRKQYGIACLLYCKALHFWVLIACNFPVDFLARPLFFPLSAARSYSFKFSVCLHDVYVFRG